MERGGLLLRVAPASGWEGSAGVRCRVNPQRGGRAAVAPMSDAKTAVQAPPLARFVTWVNVGDDEEQNSIPKLLRPHRQPPRGSPRERSFACPDFRDTLLEAHPRGWSAPPCRLPVSGSGRCRHWRQSRWSDHNYGRAGYCWHWRSRCLQARCSRTCPVRRP